MRFHSNPDQRSAKTSKQTAQVNSLLRGFCR
jgi:hypothetical protein